MFKVAAFEPLVWIFNYNHVGPRSKCADPSPSNRLVYSGTHSMENSDYVSLGAG